MGHLYIFCTILFTVYGQIIIKMKIAQYGKLPSSLLDKAYFMFQLFLNPWILSGFLSAFIASIFWMAAMTKFQISYAYPFMSLSFVLVFLLSIFLFNEPVTIYKLVGMGFIIVGIFVISRA